ncbi:GMC oxidoreductase [Parathielavia hyrcaniae]|uniref:GMC oxidoreductase n=1 Tax=Parathielavia hyrcaniae TaxID=113614 RepID=A0AAN6PUF7_9PEZI|nr:GMC oxidoreductase [Parathielavia hyrcaniae]
MGFLSAAILSVAALATAASVPNSKMKRQVSQLRSDYDFVIVGAGTSGLTVADRLSAAFPSKTVLVIEYGNIHFAPGVFDPPTNWMEGIPNPPPSWTFSSLPNPDMNNQTAFVMAGQVVGGSSATNGQFFDRGSRFDYDAWLDVGGLEFAAKSIKWDWNGILPYFKKSVTFTEPSQAVAQQYNYTWDVSAYGGTTPIYSSYATFQWGDQHILGEVWKEMGLNPQAECAGGDKEGICWVPASQHPLTGRRSHAALGHYADVLPRSNYDLLVQHQVVRVVYPNGPKHHGPPLVEVRSLADDHLFNVTVTGEVVISAGAFHTPTILQRSGIGPASFLASAGISLVVDLPGVGSNLQDHGGPPVTWNYTQPYIFDHLPDELANNATYKSEAIAAFDDTPSHGPYTIAMGNSAIYVSLPHMTPTWCTIVQRIRQIALTPGLAASYLPEDIRTSPSMVAGYIAQLLTLAQHFSNPAFPSLETPWATSVAPASAVSFLLHPLSRGTVRLNLASPLDQPILDYRSGSNPVDIDIQLAQVRFLRGVLDTPTMQGYGASEIAPGAAVAADDALLEEYVRSQSFLSFQHPCCTAAMMPRSRGGVVGVDLKVYGAEGLRVADMSVSPLLVGSHTSSTAYAIGEKAADIIIQAWS